MQGRQGRVAACTRPVSLKIGLQTPSPPPSDDVKLLGKRTSQDLSLFERPVQSPPSPLTVMCPSSVVHMVGGNETLP